jgi:NADH-quinone oxidoreductase subunit L
MFLALGVGAWSAAIFHLLTHAFFKALLFLAAGAVIFCFHHEHNIFKMGGLRKAMPLTFWGFMIGCAALSALPFTSGFYSKHEILMAAFEISPVLWAAGCLGALITGIYSFRLVFVVFFGVQSEVVGKSIGWRMSAPLLLLGFLALFGGMLQVPLGTIFPAFSSPDRDLTFNLVSAITVGAPLLGLLIAVLFYLTGAFSAQRLANYSWAKPLRLFFLGGWGMDVLYDKLFVHPFKTITQFNKNDAIDGLYLAIEWFSQKLHLMVSASQTGRLRWYASSLVLGTVAIIAIGLLS